MGSKYIDSSSYGGRYFRFTVSQVNKTTKVDWKFEVLGGSSNYYRASPIKCYINGTVVYEHAGASADTQAFPAAKGSKTGTYDIGSYGSFTIKLSGRPWYSSAGDAVTETVTLDRPTYTISYNGNGGTGVPSNQTKTHGVDIKVSSTKPTRYGYTFMGWSVPGRGYNEPYYDPGEAIQYDGNQELVAYWKKEIKLQYDGNGGTGTPSNNVATIFNGATTYTFTLSSTKPTRVGYDFLGWSTSNTATTATYQPGATLTLEYSTVLYAVWKLKTYTITFNANGGVNPPSSQIKQYGVNLTLPMEQPTRSGYRFVGWDLHSTGTMPLFLSGEQFFDNEDTTLYAVWERLGIMHVKVNGVYKPGKVWVNNYGTWETGIIFVKTGGNWRQGGI